MTDPTAVDYGARPRLAEGVDDPVAVVVTVELGPRLADGAGKVSIRRAEPRLVGGLGDSPRPSVLVGRSFVLYVSTASIRVLWAAISGRVSEMVANPGCGASTTASCRSASHHRRLEGNVVGNGLVQAENEDVPSVPQSPVNTSRAGTTVRSSSENRAARFRIVGRRVKCGAYTSASIPRSFARATTSSSSTFTWASTRVLGRVTGGRSSRRAKAYRSTASRSQPGRSRGPRRDPKGAHRGRETAAGETVNPSRRGQGDMPRWTCGIDGCDAAFDDVESAIVHQTNGHQRHECKVCGTIVPDGYFAIRHAFDEHTRPSSCARTTLTPRRSVAGKESNGISSARRTSSESSISWTGARRRDSRVTAPAFRTRSRPVPSRAPRSHCAGPASDSPRRVPSTGHNRSRRLTPSPCAPPGR